MALENSYPTAQQKLLTDGSICKENRLLFRKFFDYEEYKLKRMRGLSKLDDGCYKTLLAYVTRLRTVNRWFDNKPWKRLTKSDIKAVYDALEDGKILSRFGRPIKDKGTYYHQIIRSKPFEMAGKKALVESVMEFYTSTSGNNEDVRFIREDTFRKLVDIATKIQHKAFLWLAWDIGENSGSLLQLRKRDFTQQRNEDTNEPEYLVNLRREILKRSRTPRTEVTNYRETVELLDSLLDNLKDDDLLFSFGYRMAKKIMERAVRITKAACIPAGQAVTLKDLRSSMACDLLSKDWTTDEVNYRLGHKPSSREIDKYVNFLAIDRRKPKRKLHEHAVGKLTRELEALRDREKLFQQRQTRLKKRVEQMGEEIEVNNRLMFEQVEQLRSTKAT